MTDDDPVPLKAGGEASPELVRALRQLGKRGPGDAARLDRVAKRLEAVLADAPPPGAATNGAQLLGAKTIITGILIGVAALSWLGYEFSRKSAERAPAVSATPTPVVAPPAPPALPPVAASNEQPVKPVPAEAGNSRATVAGQSPSRRGGRHSASSSARTAAASPTSQGPASSATPEAEGTTAARAVAPAEEAAPKPAQQKLPTRAEPVEPPTIPQRSEVGLLFDARKAMPAQPLAALRLLEEHAQRFPDGQLGPEREVLRIEALRKLGRTAEANERMRAFEARYPKSLHLRRLKEQSETSPAP
jgi:hypothetical protein